MEKMKRGIFAFLAITGIVGIFAFVAGFWPMVGLLTLPITWPYFLIFRVDESQEIYGLWGQAFRLWISSFPIATLAAVAFARQKSRSS